MHVVGIASRRAVAVMAVSCAGGWLVGDLLAIFCDTDTRWSGRGPRRPRCSGRNRLVPISGEHFPDIFCSRQFLLTALALFGHRRTTERPLVHPFFSAKSPQQDGPLSPSLHDADTRYKYTGGRTIPMRFTCESFSSIGKMLYDM